MVGLTHYCFPCLAKLTQFTIELATEDADLRTELTQKVAQLIAGAFSPQTVPSHLGSKIQTLIREAVGHDPYDKIKKSDNETAAKIVASMPNEELSFKRIIQLAIIGNVIDAALFRSATELSQLEIILAGETTDLDDLERFEEIIDKAQTILFLTDNCGEIIFDRILLEWLAGQGKKIYLSPKLEPSCNDATVDDIIEYGLDRFADEIIPASSTMGLNLALCSHKFMNIWQKADLIIAKGMGHYEALWGRPEKIAFLFKVKCIPVANNAGVELNANLLRLSESCKSR